MAFASAALAAPTANEDFVIAEDAKTYTNAVAAAKLYTDAATNNIPRPDLSEYSTTVELTSGAVKVGSAANADAAGYATSADSATYAMYLIPVSGPSPLSSDDILREIASSTNALGGAVSSLAVAVSSNTTAIANLEDEASVRAWNRPGDWSLGYQPLPDSVEVVFADSTTNAYGVVSSNVTRRVAQGLTARIFTDILDPYSYREPPSLASLAMPDGGSAADAIVTVPSSGVYRVRGVAKNGEARQISVAFSLGRGVDSRTSYYVADTNAARQTANDATAGILAQMSEAGGGLDDGGNYYLVYSTVSPWFGTDRGAGNYVPYAIAPRFAATAAHYPGVPAARKGYRVDYGGGYTIKSAGGAFTLASWALTNGFLSAEVTAAGIADVLIIPLESGWEFPQNQCPYFATEEWIAANYGDLYGQTAWAVTQRTLYGYGLPVVVRSARGEVWWNTPALAQSVGAIPRLDIADLIGVFNERQWWRVQVGDSGKPVWFIDQTSGSRRDILLSHFHYVGGGPNYVKAAKIVKKLCALWNTPCRILE